MNEQESAKHTVPPQVVYYVQPPEKTADAEINLMDLWQALVSFKWLILGITLITTCAAAAVAWSLPPLYRAEVTLATVTPEEGGRLSVLSGELGGLASLAGINVGAGASSADMAIAVLKSRAFTDDFIKDEQLLPVLFSEDWDSQNNAWRVESQNDVPTLRKAYQVFDGIRSVAQDKKTGLITLSIDWKDPQQAARWANLLVVRLNQHEREAAISEAEKSLSYLKGQLAKTSVLEMQQSIYRLLDAQTKNIMLANARDQFALKVIDPAVVPEVSSKPKRLFMVGIGAAAGLFVGVLVAFLFFTIKKQRSAAKAAE